jgi:DNA-binding response OmpR family regulator
MASVLIVDDQDMVRKTLRLALESEGLDVREAVDGDEALRLYRTSPADVVVTDIVMPNKEGIETIFELRRSAPRVKIIAMSGRDTVDFLDMARKLGADHVLRKPFEMRVLIALVQSCLDAKPGPKPVLKPNGNPSAA